jgi:lipopolysaccharide heptosyltransferase I
MDVQQSPRILITRLSHIGDCVLTLPMVVAIRAKFPNAFIAWAVESPTQQLLELHPAIDEIVMIPKSWMSKPKNWFSLSKKLKSYSFDIAIDPQGISKSALLGWLSGAPKRIGAKGRWGRELSTYLNNELMEPRSSHVVDRSMEILSLIGIPNNEVSRSEMELPVCQSSLKSIRTQIGELGITKEFVLINPGGSWASKRWEMDRFGAVASYLKRHQGLMSVVVWAGEEERVMANTIHDFDTSASVIAPKTSLKELAALTSLATFFVGSDTGPMHIATAVGTPCVGLFGTTRPEDSGAYGDQHIAVQKWYQSGSCRKRRNADNDAMRDILASDVFSACDQMIDQLNLTKRQAA